MPSSSRKRKHESIAPDGGAARLRSQVGDEGNDSKENPGGANGRQLVRWKLSATDREDEAVDADGDDGQRKQEINHHTHAVLQPVSDKQQIGQSPQITPN
ncbi:hypothetical protein PGTUg99_030064 [Puccinia graminis f. sp. tritici]|uniref:Uncharacterized protein n=1 Tax=Puccinia graminis f. sp. tritici TaxID=56615 RepID=A0A5B0P475_PUCGR|nr:hypothetical protein PGTUg99_030064 [Puccinia graminis f. sp. tritici]